MTRRRFLSNSLALAGAAALRINPARAGAAAPSRVRPGMPGWPSDADWAGLKAQIGGRLAPVTAPKFDTPAMMKLIGNPFFLGSDPGLTQSSGYLDAWRTSPSAYAVTAESAADVAAAVTFAKTHNLRVVVRSGGHSYLGTSNAPDSLLIWTRPMSAITVHDAFTPQGSSAAPAPAVSVGAGCIWLHVYQKVTTEAGRYVQGGGCATVGVPGLTLGGGFGTYSKGYGMAAANLLEAEIVTADGQTRVVNHAQAPDLHWALKGGGGGTFGVVTRLTLATHELPETVGAVRVAIQAHSDAAFRRLLAAFVDYYAQHLFNPHWGEQVRATPGNRLEVEMEFQGLSQADAREAWQGFIDFANDHKDDYSGQGQFLALALPARHFWDADFLEKNAPFAITMDKRPGASPTDFFWAGNGEEAGAFWNAYTSAWLPAELLTPKNQAKLVDAWFASCRQWGVTFHLNKGLAGAPDWAVAAARDTATNPDVAEAFALAIIGDIGRSLYYGAPVDLPDARARAAKVQAAMKALRACAPKTGAYFNECDFFQPDWQRAFWGKNYPKLLAVKRRYDPDGLFYVHHGVGSEAWSADGFKRV